jgi:tRNA-dihydrouridine synthase B
MGCSVPKVTRTGAGAALLRAPDRALAAGRALFEAAGPGRAGCKLRLGWDSRSPVYRDLARRLQDAGAAWLTLHPRFARQGFSGSADYAAFESLANDLDVPLIASGDLFSAADGIRCLERGASGVMFARGALANPMIFRQYLTMRAGGRAGGGVPAGTLRALIARHARLARTMTPGRPGRSGCSPALLKMRTVVPRYVRRLPGVKALRLGLVHCESWEELEALLDGFFTGLPGAEADDGSLPEPRSGNREDAPEVKP